MTTAMNIFLPDEMRAFVGQQVAERGFESSSEYTRNLIGKQRDIEKLRGLLLDGASSPIQGVMDDAWFASLRQRAHDRVAK